MDTVQPPHITDFYCLLDFRFNSPSHVLNLFFTDTTNNEIAWEVEFLPGTYRIRRPIIARQVSYTTERTEWTAYVSNIMPGYNIANIIAADPADTFYKLRVRAVFEAIKDINNTEYFGPWSETFIIHRSQCDIEE